jgi:hypothetical protein
MTSLSVSKMTSAVRGIRGFSRGKKRIALRRAVELPFLACNPHCKNVTRGELIMRPVEGLGDSKAFAGTIDLVPVPKGATHHG